MGTISQGVPFQSGSGGNDDNDEHDPHQKRWRDFFARTWRREKSAKPATKYGWHDYPDGRAAMMYWGGGGVVARDSPCYHRLQYDLANSYYWSGNFVRDYFFFVMQWHPLLSIFMCHPNHPWTKEQRLWMFLISAGLTFIPSCAISRIFEGSPDVAVLETTTPEFAVAVVTQDAVVAAQKGSIAVATILFVTIPDTIIGVILYQLAISETRCGACPMCIPVGKCVMKYTLWIAFVVCGVNFAIGMAVLKGHPPVEALEVMCYGKLWSYGTWFIIWLLLPCQLGFISLWTYERKEEARKESAAE